MDWAAIRTAMQQAVTEMIAVPLDHVVWKGSFNESSMLVGTRVILSASSIGDIGWDEERREDDSVNPLGDQSVNRCGVRTLQWQLRVRAQNQGPDNAARTLADQLRVRVFRPSVKAILGAVGVTPAQTSATTNVDYQAAGRLLSESSFEVLCNAVENDIDTTDGAGSWIGEALISGPVKDTTGQTLGTVNVDANAKG